MTAVDLPLLDPPLQEGEEIVPRVHEGEVVIPRVQEGELIISRAHEEGWDRHQAELRAVSEGSPPPEAKNVVFLQVVSGK